MLLRSSKLAFAQLFSPDFRHVLWKSLGFTILLLIAFWFGLNNVIALFIFPLLGEWPWLVTGLSFVMGAGMMVAGGFLIAPVSAIFAGLFLDDVAREVEMVHYSDEPSGSPVPTGKALWMALKFMVLVILANMLALFALILPGVNILIFFALNGYLLGREYFQFAALRFMSESDAAQLRGRNEANIFLGGLIVAGFMSIPLLNLATPIFAAALMVHVFKHAVEHQPIEVEVQARQSERFKGQ